MSRITATTRLFLRTRATIDLDGWRVWDFVEAKPNAAGYIGLKVQSNQWQIRESPSGVRLSTLKVRDAIGLHSRQLRRIEEDHLMKFAIRD